MTEILFLQNNINDLLTRNENRRDFYLHDCEPVDSASNFASLLSACLQGTLISFSVEKMVIGLANKIIYIKYHTDTGDEITFNTLFSVSIYPLWLLSCFLSFLIKGIVFRQMYFCHFRYQFIHFLLFIMNFII